MKSKAKAPARPLPKALAKRAQALHESAQTALASRGFDALSRIREKRADIAGNLLDIADSLKVLQGDGVAEAMGRASFDELCKLDLEMSPSSARKLIAVTQHFRRETVLKLGTERAHALVELAEATPEDDTPLGLASATVTLPSGTTLDIATASAAKILEAAREIRQAHSTTRRGNTTSPAHRSRFAQIRGRARAAGLEELSLKLVASREKAGPWVQLRVRLDDFDRTLIALRKKRTPAR